MNKKLSSNYEISKMYDNGFKYAIQNEKNKKWMIVPKELYDACYGTKKKLSPYYDSAGLERQLHL